MTSDPLDSHSLSEELERLFELLPEPASVEPAAGRPATAAATEAPTPASPTPKPPATSEIPVVELQRYLEAAVTQAVAPLAAAVEAHTVALSELEASAGSAGATTDLSEQLATLQMQVGATLGSDALQAELDVLRGQLDDAFNEVEAMVRTVAGLVGDHDDQLQRLEAVAADTAASMRLLAERPLPEAPPAPVVEADVTAVTDRIERLHEDVAAQLADARAQQRNDLKQLAEHLDVGAVEVDTRRLEEVVHRGAIANAADIANLSTELTELTATIRAHDVTITDLRKQIECIKQCVLSR